MRTLGSPTCSSSQSVSTSTSGLAYSVIRSSFRDGHPFERSTTTWVPRGRCHVSRGRCPRAQGRGGVSARRPGRHCSGRSDGGPGQHRREGIIVPTTPAARVLITRSISYSGGRKLQVQLNHGAPKGVNGFGWIASSLSGGREGGHLKPPAVRGGGQLEVA